MGIILAPSIVLSPAPLSPPLAPPVAIPPIPVPTIASNPIPQLPIPRPSARLLSSPLSSLEIMEQLRNADSSPPALLAHVHALRLTEPRTGTLILVIYFRQFQALQPADPRSSTLRYKWCVDRSTVFVEATGTRASSPVSFTLAPNASGWRTRALLHRAQV